MNSILLIETDVVLLDNLVELLELEGYKAKGVSTADDAKAAIKYLKPGVIVCDEGSLNSSFDELVDLLNEEAKNNTPIIILNTMGESGKFNDADIYIKMPFQEEELLSSLDYLAGIQQA